MKKLITAAVVIIALLTSCTVPESPVRERNNLGYTYRVNNMYYTHTGGGFVVNLTKDSLECAYYRQQLEKGSK